MASGLPFKALGLTYSIISLVQGLLWICLSIIGILVYEDVMSMKVTNTTIKQIISYIRYGSRTASREKDVTMLIFFIVYLIFSVYWVIVSIELLMRFGRMKLTRLRAILYQWIAVTAIISVVDLALVILVAIDYAEYKDNKKTDLEIIMGFASRGVLIWIWNVIGIIIGFLLVKQVKQEEIKQSRYNETVQAIQAFDQALESRPPPWFSEGPLDETKNAYVNPYFVNDEEQNGPDIGTRSNYSRQTSHDPKTIDSQSMYSRQMSYDPNMIDRMIDDEFGHIDQEDDRRSRTFQNGDNWHQNDQNVDNWNQNGQNGNDFNNRNWNRNNNDQYVQQNINYNNNNENQRVAEKKKPIKVLDMELIPDEELEPPTIPPPDYTPPNTPLVRARPVLKSNPIYN